MSDVTVEQEQGNLNPEAVPDIPEPDDAERIALLEAQLREAIEAKEAAEALAEAYNPRADVSKFLMESIEDVEHRFAPQHLRDLAEAELAQINKRRLQNGFLPVNYSDEEWQASIEKVKADLLADRVKEGPPPTGPLMRTLKMVKPDGTLVQIPYEAQINNQAGSLEDGIAIYRNKGFKLPNPMLCPTQNCSDLSAVDDEGNYRFKAYCSEDHHDRTERVQGKAVENVVTGRTSSSLKR